MGKVVYVLPGGGEQVVEAREGESLMQVAVQAGVSAIEGECGGEMSCATCHVWIGDEWAGKLRRASQDELDLLEADDNFCDESRLGCQIKYTSEIDGIAARIPG
ncbi:2Fe-2S iron-sulfur cluster-binding protein [Agromyces aerolatus]|uniref:2Fe-2S iron-sulfur cluster-binding protein n=1 Tax=Agromyces sp. LY-1074 TaxID=3074080 RepID=UPI002862FD91|nr:MULTISPECIES: 2Fe-2S iron-sulfur cluster-binding protein [unclassified Agromyces]MDR5701603.1 2Fe-2S iron-sulfur cluster-binding protein [Agromyces sp. LY-1074]MDR5706133.1 2Fe-2S iron-sulfur cluster-binding protein [Agromyces sp. LY-1358]